MIDRFGAARARRTQGASEDVRRSSAALNKERCDGEKGWGEMKKNLEGRENDKDDGGWS